MSIGLVLLLDRKTSQATMSGFYGSIGKLIVRMLISVGISMQRVEIIDSITVILI